MRSGANRLCDLSSSISRLAERPSAIAAAQSQPVVIRDRHPQSPGRYTGCSRAVKRACG